MSDQTTTTPAPVFRIVRTGKGMGGFMAPPGHPDHFYEVRGYWPRGDKPVNVARRREADSYGSLSGVLENENSTYPDAVVAQARRIMDRAEITCPEAWIRQVYGYFRNSYSPDGTDRNVSNSISASKLHCQCGEDFWNRRGLDHHLTGERTGFTAFGVAAAVTPGHGEITKPLPPAEHHLGYLCVREYFPDHQPRADLITDPGNGYGQHPCAKCGKSVQYEARQDAFAEVLPGVQWRISTDCPEGGQHER